MILDKALLIKGLVGTTTLVTIGTSAYLSRDHISKWFGTSKGNNTPGAQIDQQQPQEISETELIKKVGLNCNTPSEAGTECSKLTEEGAEKISVKQEESDEKFEIDTITVGKIKLYKLSGQDTGYHKGLKFVIEDGDITKESNKKLEQFETYEIKKEGDKNKYYLSRKKKSSENIKKLLGLPEGCDLTSNSGCSEVTVDSNNIGQIKFDGASGNQNPTISGTAKLTVTKETTDTDFPHKFKFSFKANGTSSTITFNNKSFTLDTSKGTEFKIKKSGNTLSLEEAWTLEKLLEKVGLSGCTTSSPECNIKDTGLNVKQGDNNKEKSKSKESNNGGSGKIKVYTSDAEGYENNFKFVIEDGDIIFTSSNGNTISKLEQFETYEIKKEDSSTDWYLTRKKDALEEKRRILGLPDDESCKLPSSESDSKTCSLNSDKLKAIKFEGKNSSSDTTMDGNESSLTLKITKTSDSSFTDEGYKFVFETTQSNITIPKTDNGEIHIKKGTNTEFKIKKNGNSLSLEKAWSVTELAKQVGLTNCDTTTKECTISTSDSLKINNDNDKISDAKVATADQKIKYQEDVEGHNQGIKFYVENEITLNGDGNKKIEKDNVSYEIKKIDNEWYLTKKSNGVGS